MPNDHASPRVIVVDNASTDGTVQLIKAKHAAVEVIVNRRNMGFGAAVNLGIKAARTPFTLILNPDVTANRASLERMLYAALDRPDIAAVGCRLIDVHGTPQPSCRKFPTVTSFLARALPGTHLFERTQYMRTHLMVHLLHSKEPRNDACDVDWILGASMLISKAAHESIGGFDEKYFLYYEDTDWCYRAKQMGWRIVYLPAVTMDHFYYRASRIYSLRNGLTWVHGRSALRFFIKHIGRRRLHTLY